MTNEQAINVMMKYTDTDSGISEVMAEAHRMAISALERYTEDAISREDALMALTGECSHMINDKLRKRDQLERDLINARRSYWREYYRQIKDRQAAIDAFMRRKRCRDAIITPENTN